MRESDGILVQLGGKSRFASKLVQHFPRGPKCYVEPFFGGGGVFLSVPRDLYPVQVINDLNKGIVTFYKVLRERPDDLLRVCELTPYAFDEQRACRDSAGDPEDELELARRVWVRQRQNFGGRQHPAAGWRRGDHKFSPANAAAEKLEHFRAFADRFHRVEINNCDALELVETYAKPSVFIYCMHPSTEVRLEDGQRLVTVEELRVGDWIAPGRRVLQKFSRRHIGHMHRIQVQGQIKPLELTPEHRVLAIRGRKAGTRQDTRSSESLWASRELVQASDLHEGDYLVLPLGGEGRPFPWKVDKCPRTHFSPSRDLFRLIGYYAAEGYLQRGGKDRKTPYTACWGFCIDEEHTYVKDLNELLVATFGVPAVWARFRDTGTLRVRCSSKVVASFMHHYVPGTAHVKVLHPDLMNAPPEDQFEILKGWLRGDGGIDRSTRNRCKLMGTTMSPVLAHQMYTIALRCGLRPSMKLRAKRIYDVYFASEDAKKLGWDVEAKKFRSSRRVVHGHLLSRVRSNNTYAYDGEVWDIDVDGDNLFSAPYVLIHNCDPPYYPDTRGSNNDYTHEMSPEQHKQLSEKLHSAVDAGAMVAISGYDCEFYAQAYKGWRRVEYKHTVSSANFATEEQRERTEVMWMSYPASVEIGQRWSAPAAASTPKERALLKMLQREGRTR